MRKHSCFDLLRHQGYPGILRHFSMPGLDLLIGEVYERYASRLVHAGKNTGSANIYSFDEKLFNVFLYFSHTSANFLVLTLVDNVDTNMYFLMNGTEQFPHLILWKCVVI